MHIRLIWNVKFARVLVNIRYKISVRAHKEATIFENDIAHEDTISAHMTYE